MKDLVVAVTSNPYFRPERVAEQVYEYHVLQKDVYIL
jgi:hypothetical protein